MRRRAFFQKRLDSFDANLLEFSAVGRADPFDFPNMCAAHNVMNSTSLTRSRPESDLVLREASVSVGVSNADIARDRRQRRHRK